MKIKREFSGYMIKVFQEALLDETGWEVLFYKDRHTWLLKNRKKTC